MRRALILAALVLTAGAADANAARVGYGCNGKSGCAGFYDAAPGEENVVRVSGVRSSGGGGEDTFRSNVLIHPIPAYLIDPDYLLGPPPLPPSLGNALACSYSGFAATCENTGWWAAVYAGDGDDSIIVSAGAGNDLFGGAGADIISARDYGARPDVIDCGAGIDTAVVDVRDVVVGGCETVEVG